MMLCNVFFSASIPCWRKTVLCNNCLVASIVKNFIQFCSSVEFTDLLAKLLHSSQSLAVISNNTYLYYFEKIHLSTHKHTPSTLHSFNSFIFVLRFVIQKKYVHKHPTISRKSSFHKHYDIHLSLPTLVFTPLINHSIPSARTTHSFTITWNG